MTASELRVALTFDAEHPSRPPGPAGNAEHLLEVLAARDVRATFFIQGRWATAYPGVAKSIAREGHTIGSHSHHHAMFTLLSPDGVRADLKSAQEAIAETAGSDPRPWFRFPFGDGEGDEELRSALSSLGYRNVGWDVDPDDWDHARTTDEVLRSVVEGAQSHGDGAIVLLHTWPGSTGEALGDIIERLRAEGARFVGVEELLDPAGRA